ncbi:MAG TPA: purple acid phosphatase [Polyangiaceae bacterium]|nr:purple acid phosphatase [Polyangiaceae bacterium]
MRYLRASLAFSGLLVACSSGLAELAAKKTGSLSQPLASRSSLEPTLEQQCGDGRALASWLTRNPYLQQLTDTSVIVALSAPSAEGLSVEVTTPAGQHVLTASVGSDSPASPDGMATLTASLEGLSPDTTYCYAIPGVTARAGFVTAPAPGVNAPVRFIAFGDSGDGNGDQERVFEQMQTVPFQLVLHLGDLAYESGGASEIDTYFFRVYAPILKSFPAYPVAGNHDYATDDAKPFRQAFVLPTNGYQERWYSFDRGAVHFVGLDTEQISTKQADWLEQDLKANRLPWTIVFGHRPPYSSGEHGGNGDFVQYFVPILERYHVDLVLSGHEHDYERFWPMAGVVYVVSGGGGRGTRPVGSGASTAFSEAVLHFLYGEVQGSRLTLHAIDGVGREFDQAVVEHS